MGNLSPYQAVDGGMRHQESGQETGQAASRRGAGAVEIGGCGVKKRRSFIFELADLVVTWQKLGVSSPQLLADLNAIARELDREIREEKIGIYVR